MRCTGRRKNKVSGAGKFRGRDTCWPTSSMSAVIGVLVWPSPEYGAIESLKSRMC